MLLWASKVRSLGGTRKIQTLSLSSLSVASWGSIVSVKMPWLCMKCLRRCLNSAFCTSLILSEWVSIFHKGNVRFQKKSLDHLYFYSGEKDVGSDAIRSSAMRPDLPLKVSCSHCRTPIADEGRHMWLAFTTLFGFTVEDGIPDSFKHGCHLFYGQRCVNLSDDEVKWEGHENKTKQWTSS